MAFTGTEDHTTTLEHAATLTKNFRSAYPEQPKAIYFSRQTLEAILAQEDVVGIRFYFGMENGEFRLVFCGAMENEDDNLSILANHGIFCPPCCSRKNALNSNE